MTDLAALVVRMQADNSEYVKALDQATKRLGSFQKEQNEALEKLGEKIAEAFAIDKIVEFGVSTIESLASLDKMSQSAGIAVEELSSLRLAAAASGISQEELGVSFKKLNVALSEASGNATSKAGVAFRALGIDVHNADGSLKSVSQALPEIANKFQQAADGPAKAAIAVALMGKAGTDMIPVLNGGAAGLDKFQQAARDAGIVIGEDLAKSAEEASQKFMILKAQVVDGFGAQLATKLLPSLLAVEDQMEKTGGKATYLGNAADVVVGILKTMVVVPVAIIGTLKSLVEAFQGLETAFVHLSTFQWSKIGDDIASGLGDAWTTLKNTFTFSSDTVTAGLGKQKAAVDALADVVMDPKWKHQLVDPSTIAEIDKADLALTKFSQGIKEQSLAFGLGDVAMVKFKLSTGQLSEELGKASAAGKKAAADAITFATALQTKKDDKTIQDYTAKIGEQITAFGQGTLAAAAYKLSTGAIGEALTRAGVKGEEFRNTILALTKIEIEQKNVPAIQAINDQLDVLQGKLTGAAAAAFDLQHKALSQDLASTNDTAGQAAVQNLKDKTVALAAYSEEVAKAGVIQTNLGNTEANIAALQQSGAITSLQAQKMLSDAQAISLDQLTKIADAEQHIADVSGLPKLTEQTQQFKTSLIQLSTQIDPLTKEIRGDLENAMVGPLTEAEMGTKSLKAAFSDMVKSIERDLLTIANKNIAESIFGTGGAGGGAAGGLASLLGGGGGSGLGAFASLFGGGGGSAIASTGAAAAGTDTGALADSIMPFASGGQLDAGKVGLVGEAGPELVYSGAKDMQVVPTGQVGKNVSVTNHFTVQSANGTISRQSQMQVAAAAARSLSSASRRNN